MKNMLVLVVGLMAMTASSLRAEKSPEEIKLDSNIPFAGEAALPSVRSPHPAQRAECTNTSYEAAISNNDGSVTLYFPFFKNPMGIGGVPISADKSDLPGVCKLYCLGSYHGSSYSWYKETVIIGQNATMTGLTGNNSPPSGPRGLTSLVCGPGRENAPTIPTVSDRCEKTSRNDDGSWTIYRPFVARPMRSGSTMRISKGSSSLLGVCRYFGFGLGVIWTESERTYAPVAIGESGHIYNIITSGPSQAAIESIVCR